MDLTEHFGLKTMPFRPGSVAVTNAIMAANEIAAAVRQGTARVLLVGAPGSGITTTLDLSRQKISARAQQDRTRDGTAANASPDTGDNAALTERLDILDEAERLPPGTLLARMQKDDGRILVAAYGGEPDEALLQAAGKTVRLRGMSPVDAAVYLKSAIEASGGDSSLLSREAVSELVSSAGGSLRHLRALVGRSMVEAMVAGESVVTATHVEAAKLAGEIEAEAGTPSGQPVQASGLGGARMKPAGTAEISGVKEQPSSPAENSLPKGAETALPSERVDADPKKSDEQAISDGKSAEKPRAEIAGSAAASAAAAAAGTETRKPPVTAPFRPLKTKPEKPSARAQTTSKASGLGTAKAASAAAAKPPAKPGTSATPAAQSAKPAAAAGGDAIRKKPEGGRSAGTGAAAKAGSTPAGTKVSKRRGMTGLIAGGALAGTAVALAAVLLLRDEPPPAAAPTAVPAMESARPAGSDPLAVPAMDGANLEDMRTAQAEEIAAQQAEDAALAQAEAAAQDGSLPAADEDQGRGGGEEEVRVPTERGTSVRASRDPLPPRTPAADRVRAVTSAPQSSGRNAPVRAASIRIYYVDGNDASEDRARDVARALRRNGWDVDSVDDAAFPIRAPAARFFNNADSGAANELGVWLQNALPGDLGSITPEVVDMTAIAGAEAGEIELLVP